jgi:Fic family protein
MEFLKNLDSDLKSALKAQLRDLWTHTSTAIEGNTLTLGETKFVIEEGLTVSGKPLKDHHEVVGHARAIDLVYALIGKDEIKDTDLFDLHRAVMTQIVIDVYKPVGGWKKEPNGTYFFNEDTDKQDFFEYAKPEDTPALMAKWLKEFNQRNSAKHSREKALGAYVALHVSLVNIHPFFDGNGRMARLVCNIPVLKSGHPPIVIPSERGRDYINILVKYQLDAGIPKADKKIVLHGKSFDAFKAFCSESWGKSLDLVDRAHQRQTTRDKGAEIKPER